MTNKVSQLTNTNKCNMGDHYWLYEIGPVIGDKVRMCHTCGLKQTLTWLDDSSEEK
jgi:hypothetical protein